MAKKTKNSKNVKKENRNSKFSFDNEIVIGVTKAPEKEETKKNKSSINNKNKDDKKKKDSTRKSNKNNTKNSNTKSIKKKNTKKEKIKLSPQEQEIKIQKRKRNFRIAKYITLSILLLTTIICAMFSPLFNIKKITINGNEKITENEILSLSGMQVGENTYKISKSKVKQKIKENAYIDEVTIKRKLPSEIVINIEERKPMFMLEYANGYVYISNQGYMIDISTEKLEIPIIQGAETSSENFAIGNRLNKEDLQKLSTVLKIMESANNNEIGNLITRIDIENSKNYKISFDTKEKVAYIGDCSNLSTRILKLKVILEKEEGNAGEIFIDMDLNNSNPVFRQRV